MSKLRKRLEELESLTAEAVAERDRLDKICREMIVAMEAAEAEWTADKQALLDDRDHWFALWKQASSEVLQRTRPTRFKMPGPLPKPVNLKGEGSLSDQVLRDRGYTEDEIRGMFSGPGQHITSESMADCEAGKTLTLDEFWAQFDEEAWRNLIMPDEEMDESKGTRGLDPIKEGIRDYMRRKHKKPAPPGDMEGVLSELERLRIEVEELCADRDRWMHLWRQAANESLRNSPMPPETHALLNILNLGMEDVASRRVESIEEVRKRITGAPEDPDPNEIQAEVREVRRARAKRKGLL